MVYMHFPSKLTEEEEMLQKKFAKLRKKKRLLQALRTPKNEAPPVLEEQKKKKSFDEAADATEKAKKLLKSGAIKVEAEKKDHQGFKRTKRQKETEKSAVGFTPFASTQSELDEETAETPTKKMKGLYDSFVSSRERLESENRDGDAWADRERDRERETFKRRPRNRERDLEPPKRGHTVYINGQHMTEEMVRKYFSNIGKIVNLTMEPEKSCAFVTFEKMDSADEAIQQMNNSMVSGIQLKVSMARRQPTFEQVTDSSNSSWSSIAASKSQKGTSQHKEQRDLVTYDDSEDIF